MSEKIIEIKPTDHLHQLLQYDQLKHPLIGVMDACQIFSDRKKETGRSARDSISDFVIERAEESLLDTDDSVSEITNSSVPTYPHYSMRLSNSKTGRTSDKYRSLALAYNQNYI